MSDREAHLLDRVRETAKRCIDLGVRVDIPGWVAKSHMEWLIYKDYVDACEAALFQLAEVAGWGEMYTKEDVDNAYDQGFVDGKSSAPRESVYDSGFDFLFKNRVE